MGRVRWGGVGQGDAWHGVLCCVVVWCEVVWCVAVWVVCCVVQVDQWGGLGWLIDCLSMA